MSNDTKTVEVPADRIYGWCDTHQARQYLPNPKFCMEAVGPNHPPRRACHFGTMMVAFFPPPDPDEEIIDAMAKAIFIAATEQHATDTEERWRNIPDNLRDLFLKRARAALAAYREVAER